MCNDASVIDRHYFSRDHSSSLRDGRNDGQTKEEKRKIQIAVVCLQ